MRAGYAQVLGIAAVIDLVGRVGARVLRILVLAAEGDRKGGG